MKKRILFVDDEPRVLDGFRRSLRRYRHRWDTYYAEGGAAAKLQLEQETFDIVVSDMRMPGIDGVALLTHVREHYPDTIRIILTGQTQREAALRSVSVSHQFLSKPCEGDQLRNVLDRACAVRDLCTDAAHRSIISKLGALPSAPKLYLELNKKMADENTSMGEVAELIEKDIAMSVKLLQIVNSAYFGLQREISNVRDAVSLLGMSMIRSLVLAEGAFKSLQCNEAFGEADLRREQAHGMLTASVAHAICPNSAIGEQAMLASMLHDVGIIILATQFPQEFAMLEPGVVGDSEREKASFGMSHAEAGAYLLGSWGLPIRVTEAVAFHHNPEAVEHDEFEVVTAVHVANGLVCELMPTHAPLDNRTHIDEAYLERLGLSDQLQDWRDLAREIIECPEEQSDAA